MMIPRLAAACLEASVSSKLPFRSCGTFFRATCLTVRRSGVIGPLESVSGHLVSVLCTVGLVLSLSSVVVVGQAAPAKSVVLVLSVSVKGAVVVKGYEVPIRSSMSIIRHAFRLPFVAVG